MPLRSQIQNHNLNLPKSQARVQGLEIRKARHRLMGDLEALGFQSHHQSRPPRTHPALMRCRPKWNCHMPHIEGYLDLFPVRDHGVHSWAGEGGEAAPHDAGMTSGSEGTRKAACCRHQWHARVQKDHLESDLERTAYERAGMAGRPGSHSCQNAVSLPHAIHASGDCEYSHAYVSAIGEPMKPRHRECTYNVRCWAYTRTLQGHAVTECKTFSDQVAYHWDSVLRVWDRRSKEGRRAGSVERKTCRRELTVETSSWTHKAISLKSSSSRGRHH